MKTILIDTNFYGGIMGGEKNVYRAFYQADEVLVCSIVIGELLFGFKNGSRERYNFERFQEFISCPSIRVVSVTQKTAEFFALISCQLRKAGTPLPSNDIWIASCAMEHGVAIATCDKHFTKIQGLLLV